MGKQERGRRAASTIIPSLFLFLFSSILLLFIYLATLRGLRDRTWALGSESVESQPLDCQGIPAPSLF